MNLVGNSSLNAMNVSNENPVDNEYMYVDQFDRWQSQNLPFNKLLRMLQTQSSVVYF